MSDVALAARAVEASVKMVEEELGPVDVLVNSAGGSPNCGCLRRLRRWLTIRQSGCGVAKACSPSQAPRELSCHGPPLQNHRREQT